MQTGLSTQVPTERCTSPSQRTCRGRRLMPPSLKSLTGHLQEATGLPQEGLCMCTLSQYFSESLIDFLSLPSEDVISSLQKSRKDLHLNIRYPSTPARTCPLQDKTSVQLPFLVLPRRTHCRFRGTALDETLRGTPGQDKWPVPSHQPRARNDQLKF